MPRDQVRATPRNSALGAVADFLAKSYSPERTQQMQGVAKFLDMPAISETIDRLSYDPSGRSLFTGAGGLGGTTRFRPEVLDAAMAVAPGAGALGKLAAQGTMAAGRAGARIAERAVPRIMERGGMGAEMLQGMSRGTVSPMDVYRVLNEGVKGPQSEALRLAQQRAALPPSKGGLGLPTNNTPQQRARAMDFEERGFHETEGANIENGLTNFDVRRAGAAASDEQTPYAMFIKPHPAGLGIAENNPAQMPLMVKSNLTDENIMRSFANRDELQQYLNQFPHIKQSTKAVRDLDNQMADYMDELSKKMDKLYAEGKTIEADSIDNSMTSGSPLMKAFDARMHELAATSKEQITDLFKSQGVGTVGLRDDAGALGRNTITEMVLDPNDNVRSRFAAFDPFRRTAAVAAAMGVAAPNLMAKEIEDPTNQPPEYQSGGVVKLLQGMLVNSGEKAITAAQRAAAGRAAAELIKSQEQVKASEALGQLMEKGFKQTTTTQADRTRVGGGNIGGAPFPALSQADPAYAGKVWGVMDEGTASRLKNLTTPDTAWTTMLGSAIQLKTNPVVFDKLKRGFIDSMKQGNLSDELAGKINHNLSLTFGKGADIRDPGIWKQADTFDKRAALADAMMGQGIAPGLGGVALGGEKSGRGVIFRPTDILKRETEPSLLHTQHGGDVPTYAAGPRLFSLEPESMYRPDLHPGFPTLIKGEDLNYNMMPTPTEVYLPDWHARFKTNNPERKAPGYYDLALGVEGEGLPSQALNNEYIRHLLREGFAEGGAVHMDEGGAAFGVFPQMKPRRAQQDREAAANAPLSALRGWAAGTAGLAGDIEGLARAGISQLPPQLLTAFPALRAFGIGSRADPTPQMPTTEFYNEYLPGAQLNQTPTGKLFTGAGNVLGGTGATSIARLGIKSTSELADLAARIAAEAPRSGSRAAQLGIVKLPNGNFLTGRTKKDFQPLKTSTFVGETPAQRISKHEELLKDPTLSQDQRDRVQRMLDVTKGEAAIDKWIDSNLTNYVQKQMGTADDPVRLMFDKRAQEIDAQYAKDIEKSERIAQRATGESDPRKQANLMREAERIKAEANIERQTAVNFISHKPALLDEYLHEPLSGEQVRRAKDVKEQRRAAGFPEEGLGQSPMAKAWEISSDEVIASHRAGDIQKAQPHDTNFMTGHYSDIAAENPYIAKLDPNTPLYSAYTGNLGFDHIMDVLREDVAAGRIRPEQLNKFSITDAIRRTSEYDRDLASKMNASRAAAREGLPTYREYPEGYKWIQLNRPGAFAQESEAMGHSVRGYEPPKGHPDWVEGSGDAGSSGYGHGGWEAIKSGDAKVYSLVDPKGESHVTIEVGRPYRNRGFNVFEQPTGDEYYSQMNKFVAGQNDGTVSPKLTFAEWWRASQGIAEPPPMPYEITQVKGKGNAAPQKGYLPYVQDFVKSGDMPVKRDLQNTGLRDLQRTPKLDEYLKQKSVEVPRYLDEGEYQKYESDFLMDQLYPKNDPQYLPPQTPEGMAQGGFVSNHFDPIKIKQIIAGLDNEYDPENIQQIIAQRESAYA